MSDLQVLHNKATRIIIDLDYRSSASAALVKLRVGEVNNLFSHDFEITYSQDIHKYNTRCKSNIRKSVAKHSWGHWKSINFASNDWNEQNHEIRETKDLRFLNCFC